MRISTLVALLVLFNGSAQAMTCTDRLQVCHNFCIKSMSNSPGCPICDLFSFLRIANNSVAAIFERERDVVGHSSHASEACPENISTSHGGISTTF